jgi:GR25 family glycosyltransferase involved in LPS biosynthesis
MSYKIYCLNYNNPERRASMMSRFKAAGFDDSQYVLHGGTSIQDTRIAGRGLISHTEKCWSCMYGHLDMIRDFIASGEDYGVFCEDDILIDRDIKERIPHIIIDFEALALDTLLLGYLITYQMNDTDNMDKQSVYVDLATTETTQYRYYTYGDIWGTQMYMLSRAQAQRIIEKYANGYADRFLANPNEVFPPFSADWTITKEGNRRIVYPMLAIEDGKSNYDDEGQRIFHNASHNVHKNVSNYI